MGAKTQMRNIGLLSHERDKWRGLALEYQEGEANALLKITSLEKALELADGSGVA